MCVAMPGRVTSIAEASPGAMMGHVEFGDRVLEINLVMLPDIEIGDHVLVHSGYGIRIVPDEVVAQVRRGSQPAED